jgi:hypothetical protein
MNIILDLVHLLESIFTIVAVILAQDRWSVGWNFGLRLYCLHDDKLNICRQYPHD